MTANPSSVASQRIADILAERILAGDLAPGARIKQDELAEELDISRIPVRDALRMLEARGLVVMRPNAGARVTALTTRDLEVSFEIRARVEPLLLAESVPGLTEGDIADLSATMARIERATDLDETIALGREFHWITYRRHDTPLLAQIVERMWDTTQSYRRAYMKLSLGQGNRTHDVEHRLLYDAICRGEIETAQSVLSMHIRRTSLGLQRYAHRLSAAPEARAVPPE